MKKIPFILLLSVILLASMFSGCIGGDEEKNEVWDGNIEDLLLNKEDLGEGYEVETDYFAEPEDLADDVTDLEAHDFVEGASSEFAYMDFLTGELIIGAQMVIRFGADKMENVIDDFRANMEEEEDFLFVERNLGSYGDDSIGLVVEADEFEGFGAYAVGFTKDDIMVFILIVTAEDEGALVKSMAEKIEAKF